MKTLESTPKGNVSIRFSNEEIHDVLRALLTTTNYWNGKATNTSDPEDARIYKRISEQFAEHWSEVYDAIHANDHAEEIA